MKIIIVNSILVFFIIQIIFIWIMFVRPQSRFRYYFNFNNRFILKNFNTDTFEKSGIKKPIEPLKEIASDKAEIKFKDEVDFDLPFLDANTSEFENETVVEARINKELKVETTNRSDEVEFNKYVQSIPFHLNGIYRLIYESMSAGYLEVEDLDTEEKLDREVEFYIEDYQQHNVRIDPNLLFILKGELRKNFIPFLRQFIVIKLNPEESERIKKVKKQSKKLDKSNYDECTYQDLQNIHNAIKTNKSDKDGAK